MISYTGKNGYTGILYAESSYRVLDPEGKEVLHTGFTNIRTEEELIEDVEGFPEFQKHLMAVFEKLKDEEATNEENPKG